MGFPPGFYFYLSFAFSFLFFLFFIHPSVIHLFTHPSYPSFSFLLLILLLVVLLVVAVIVVFILLYSTVLFFHIPQMDFKGFYRYMYFPDGYTERSNK